MTSAAVSIPLLTALLRAALLQDEQVPEAGDLQDLHHAATGLGRGVGPPVEQVGDEAGGPAVGGGDKGVRIVDVSLIDAQSLAAGLR